MGGSHSIPCNNIIREIWQWCKDREVWITPVHILGVENTEADLASRVFNDQTEWRRDPQVLTDIFTLFGRPVLDLFAHRLNYQLPRYVSWIPHPNAVGVNAFTLDWGTQYNYAFPPFSLIPQVLQNWKRTKQRWFWWPLIGQLKAPCTEPSATSQSAQHRTSAFQPRKGTSIEGTTTAIGMSLVRESLRDKGILERAEEIILQSWREETQKQYRSTF